MSQNRKLRLLSVGCDDITADLEQAGYDVLVFASEEELLKGARAARGRACLVGPSSIASGQIVGFAKRLRRKMPFTDVVAWAPNSGPEQVRQTLKQGVQDIVADGSIATLVERLGEIIERQTYLPRLLKHRADVDSKWRFEGILSRNSTMKEIFEVCVRTAATDATVLILGETGTGKELIARAFHRRSNRSGRLVALNCAAVPENLIDSELFGHVRGAFTGADSEKIGLFRYADGGTLFLDEIGHIPLQVQYRLLRVLQENTIRPVGSDKEIPVNVRVIAATSARLDEAVQEEEFREDLLYRLDVIRILVPPLRERRDDILFLFGHFLKTLSKHHSLPRPEMTAAFLDAMQTFDWPGNVRQLENCTERLLLTKQDNEKLTVAHFAQLVATLTQAQAQEEEFPSQQEAVSPRSPDEETADYSISMKQAVDTARLRVERSYILNALQTNNGRIARAAHQLGISRRTLQRKMIAYGIGKTEFRQGEP